MSEDRMELAQVAKYEGDVDRLTRELAEAKAELAAARKDAERLQYVINTHWIDADVTNWPAWGPGTPYPEWTDSITAAIDSARGER